MSKVRLYQAANSIEANLLAGLLNHCGIATELRGEALGGAIGELPADLLQIELWVDEQQLPAAQQQLNQWQQQSSQGNWQCSQCHEQNPASFEQCWQCGHAANRSE
ncbi:DUF2007 domain-containing protein [Neiella sp. HB171785]|uniref:DUF2007 domain-containing protein n=1 Tax=Neiella litorisoli TaxID=2771431 RepID=A0A8J6QJD6_9GAMM|nr:DUF2007 domain-containing protein [Neiella litorisoli]MBD1390189.1 DUF2007 domain-containing protein [Neiella litorisoli]